MQGLGDRLEFAEVAAYTKEILYKAQQETQKKPFATMKGLLRLRGPNEGVLISSCFGLHICWVLNRPCGMLVRRNWGCRVSSYWYHQRTVSGAREHKKGQQLVEAWQHPHLVVGQTFI